MKRIVRKITIILFIFMVPTLLIPCAPQLLPEAFAEGMTINDWRQQSENNGNNPTNDKFKELIDKTISTSGGSVDVDREQINQEIQENVRNIEDNVLLNFNSKSLNSPGAQLQSAGEKTRNIIERWDPQTGVETLKNGLQELADREGINLRIDENDNITMSFVYEGTTYSITTSAAVNISEEIKKQLDENRKQALIETAPSGAGIKEQPPIFTGKAIIAIDASTSAACTTVSFDSQNLSYGKACANPYHTATCPKCGLGHDKGSGGFQVGFSSCSDSFHSKICPDCGAKDYLMDYTGTGSAISQGHPEIVFGIGGLAVGFIAAMLIFRKKKNTPALDEDTADKNKENDEA